MKARASIRKMRRTHRNAWPGRREPTAGVTLLELLVALTIIGLLAAMLMEFVRFSGAAFRGRVEASAAQSQIDKALALLRRGVQAAIPAQRTEPDGRRAVLFDGDADNLKLVVRASEIAAVSGEVLLDGDEMKGLIAIALGGEDAQTFTVAPLIEVDTSIDRPHHVGGTWLSTIDAAPSARTRVILPAGYRLRFEYFGVRAANGAQSQPGPATWAANWRGQPTLPSLVRVSLATDEKATMRFTVAPRMSAATRR